MNAKIIIPFNHKGGVGRTTTVFHVAWKLTQLNCRVLVVDGDPQCNLTALLLGKQFDKYYGERSKTRTDNIRDAVSVVFEGKIRPIQAISCFSPEQNQKLFLLPGHMNLSEYEPTLNLALSNSNAYSTLQNIPGAFYELIRCCCEQYEIDYVLVDVNPSLNALSQIFFMISDGFLIPACPDAFSLMALKTLRDILPLWKRQAGLFHGTFLDSTYPLPRKDMKFLGEVIQRFKFSRKTRNPTLTFQKNIKKVQDFVEDDLCPVFEKAGMLADISGLKTAGILTDYCLAEIPGFGSRFQKSAAKGLPVFFPAESDDKEDDSFNSQKITDREYERIARVIMELMK